MAPLKAWNKARPSRPPPGASLISRLSRAPACGLSGGCNGVGAAARADSAPQACLGRNTSHSSAASPRSAGGGVTNATAARIPQRAQVLVRATGPATRPEAVAPGASAGEAAAPPPLPPPPLPPPLSELPTPMSPDAIPPLLDWVTTAAARPVAVQCILERFFSPQALQCVRAAVELALNGGGGQGPLVLPSHLALAALSSPHPDCAAALGVLHHGGLSLQGCVQLLLAAAAEAEAARVGARGTSSSSQDGVFSVAVQHFLFQSYRWAVYTGRWEGHNSVLPCHLLWALPADPRVAYSWDRRDPLDPAVQPWQDWRPPLVGLMEAAVGLKLLERAALVYEQYTDLSWLRCEGPSQPLAQQVDELLLLNDTLAAIDPRSISSSSQTLHSLLAGRAAMLVGALGGTNEPAPNAAIAAYIAATTTTTAAELQLLPWPTDGAAPPWLEGLTLQQRVRLLTHLAHVSKAAEASSPTSLDTSALDTTAAAVNQGLASVHASRELQRQAAMMLVAAGRPLAADGWLRQLASYGAVASKPAFDVFLAVLAALASRAAPAASEPPPPPGLLVFLSELLRAYIQQPHMVPNEALQALQGLRSLCKAGDESMVGMEDISMAVLLAAGTARGRNLASLVALTATVFDTYTKFINLRQQLAFLGMDPALLSAVVDQRAAGGAGGAAPGGPTDQQQAGGPDSRVVI
ncbi:hypothetical protein TSOC_005962 [Tetrabaena socialis]|uniref:Uncharacterized protein n=1 Tax=Tetrabaena socialis TaxID=47790 RepID=A0A2J8A4W1_9CHLO|nr:hypothetical protein TSOC_005962 [Tetrabaena socialis]|eukprot:PNH07572.1 hypothetical protein TSOC_005962 [Tetrabaena socialis]